MRLTGEGIWGAPKDPDSALRVLRRSVELGVNFIDTADSYGPYVNEELIAKALAPYPADLVIATKGGWNRPGPDQWTHKASPKHLREAAESSLKRLRVDRIDVYQLHAPDPGVPFHASVETLAELQAEGKIRFVALSNVTKEHVERARKIVPIVSVQNRYSFGDREWDYVVEYCEREGIGFIPWFPLADEGCDWLDDGGSTGKAGWCQDRHHPLLRTTWSSAETGSKRFRLSNIHVSFRGTREVYQTGAGPRFHAHGNKPIARPPS